MMAAAQRLEPIYNELRELVKDSYYVARLFDWRFVTFYDIQNGFLVQ